LFGDFTRIRRAAGRYRDMQRSMEFLHVGKKKVKKKVRMCRAVDVAVGP